MGPPPRRHVPDPLYRDLRRAEPGAGDRPRPGRRVPRRRDRCAGGGTSTGGQPAGRCRGAAAGPSGPGGSGYAAGRVRGGRALVVLAGHPASPVRGLIADPERRGHLQQRRGTAPAPGGRHGSDPPTPPVPSREATTRAQRALMMSSTRSLASPKSIEVLSRKNSGFWTPAYPAAIERLKTMTSLAFQTSSTGIPAIGEVGSSTAAGLTVSLAPMTRTTSVAGKSSLISSISRTMS